VRFIAKRMVAAHTPQRAMPLSRCAAAADGGPSYRVGEHPADLLECAPVQQRLPGALSDLLPLVDADAGVARAHYEMADHALLPLPATWAGHADLVEVLGDRPDRLASQDVPGNAPHHLGLGRVEHVAAVAMLVVVTPPAVGRSAVGDPR
jgi:hypothetical protein